MSVYIVDLQCPKCGEAHRMTSGLLLDCDPIQPGNPAALHGKGDLPTALASLLNDKVWCETAGQYVQQQDRQRVFLRPR